MAGGISMLARLFDSDVFYSFRRNPLAVVSAVVLFICVAGSVFSPWLAPTDPFDLASLNVMDSFNPPSFMPDGSPGNLLGTDEQGRDVLSSIMYGTRISLFVGALAVAFAISLGVTVGLIAGYLGGITDAVLMRITDVQLSFPSILIALLVDGIARAILPRELHNEL